MHIQSKIGAVEFVEKFTSLLCDQRVAILNWQNRHQFNKSACFKYQLDSKLTEGDTGQVSQSREELPHGAISQEAD